MNEYTIPRNNITLASIIDDAITLNWQHLNRPHVCGSISDIMDPMTFAREFRTVKVDVGRQSGKTAYLANNAQVNDVIVVRDTRTANCMTNVIEFKAPIVSVYQLERYRLAWTKQDMIVWVDDASHMTKEQLDCIYSKYVQFASQFVLLG